MGTAKPNRAGRPVADIERDDWLAHLAAWLAEPAGDTSTNADRVNAAGLERAAGLQAGTWANWRNTKRREKLTRAGYLALLPWLAVWYGYQAPGAADIESRFL